jgi:hypothetical protein
VDDIAGLVAEIRAFRPFLPAKDFATSLRFYKTIGFEAYLLGETLAELNLGTHVFLLQGYYVKEWAENMMMHVLVKDVDACGGISIHWPWLVNSMFRRRHRPGSSRGASPYPTYSIRLGCCGTLRRLRRRPDLDTTALK